jgi:hypothetical protein
MHLVRRRQLGGKLTFSIRALTDVLRMEPEERQRPHVFPVQIRLVVGMMLGASRTTASFDWSRTSYDLDRRLRRNTDALEQRHASIVLCGSRVL